MTSLLILVKQNRDHMTFWISFRKINKPKNTVSIAVGSTTHSFTSRIHEGLERIAERRSELQDAERELATELDLSESRRREIEGQLDSQEAHAERGLRH